eukprot:TRINITY_DN8647_c0_g1_i5.p1 TRINITY_DN8647_c0_g1~~TRINITY_DN8647_c0_g1_i5.p1  ORF type:complete len:377 (-),score=74.83 TRINITY_DN8647_c0_g1_i5:185-1315(-)
MLRKKKKMFSGGKELEEYQGRDIERELGLDQNKLIQLAMLLGSDYTEGVSGIGIVNAMEVVHAYSQEESGLLRFKYWMEAPDTQNLDLAGKLDSSQQTENEQEQDFKTESERAIERFKEQHKNVKKNWKLPKDFPDAAISKAYREATVDQNKTKFAFGKPQQDLLKRWCNDKLGWDDEKTGEQLDGCLKAYGEQQAQLTMDQFLQFRERFAKIRSTRLQTAVAGITGRSNPELVLAGIPQEDRAKNQQPKKPNSNKSEETNSGKGQKRKSRQKSQKSKLNLSQSKKRKKQKQVCEEDFEICAQDEQELVITEIGAQHEQELLITGQQGQLLTEQQNSKILDESNIIQQQTIQSQAPGRKLRTRKSTVDYKETDISD